MKNPAASSGVSERRDAKFPKGVTPECFNRGSSPGFALDSRLKHAGMTDFRKEIRFSQQAAGNRPTVIENYPDDKYGPSCLIFGRTAAGRPIHVQCSYSSRPLVKIITVYEPDSERWIDFKLRRES